MKMSKKEAGKLGAAKSKITILLAKEKRIEKYNKNPRLCVKCYNTII